GDSTIDVYITTVPIKSANSVLSAVRSLIQDEYAVDLQHLRRFAKLHDLPPHLKSQVSPPETTPPASDGQPSLCLLVAPTASIDILALKECISNVLPLSESNEPAVWTIPVPQLAPTSQAQATKWTATHWPTVYKKNNPFGPHPHILSRAEDEMTSDLDRWMGMAHSVAQASTASGIGEGTGAVIVQRENGTSRPLALAGDARWANGRSCTKGNVMAHSILRAVGMIAQKLRTAEREKGDAPPPSSLDKLESAMFFDMPVHPEEHSVFNESTLSPDGYLCHNLEIYLTHEPCVMCSMALLHSRFGRVVIDWREPATGGLCSEGTAFGAVTQPHTSRLGHGLFWRKELNWQPLKLPGWFISNRRIFEFAPVAPRRGLQLGIRTFVYSLAPLAPLYRDTTEPIMAALGGKGLPDSASKKRKATTQPKFYAVRAGRHPGVFSDWNDCKESITGFKGASFKSFSTQSEAEAFVSGRESNAGPSAPVGEARFYGVASGHNPGVYTDWTTAQEQIKGWKLPKYKRFSTRGEAEAFVQAGNRRGKVELSTTELIDEYEPPGEFDDELSDVESLTVPSKKRKTSPAASADKTKANTVQIAATTSAAKSRASDAKSKPLSIYTDGSSLANGKVGAVAGVGVFFGDGDDRNISEALEGELQTNQRAELTAILRALEIAPMHREVHIYTDSNYSINCVTTWFKKWETNNWLTSTNQPVMNKDLVVDILARIRERQGVGSGTIFNWIKGHSNDPSNEAADRLAVSGAQRAQARRRNKS
ncbi:hypothetical protein V492_05582, partial [Pseudogymnoascus sp. VKM F-4246]